MSPRRFPRRSTSCGRPATRSIAVAVVLAVLAGGCSLLGGGGDSQTLTAWFPRAVALYKSSDVRVLGLSSGKVADVEPQGDRVKVVLHVDRDVPLPDDVQAMIVPQSLIGERYIQLFPAYKVGDAKLADHATIPLERTSVPVEPDEALASLKKFLDTLDPESTGRLVKNLATDLKGAGPDLNRALAGLGDLASTVAAKDDAIGRIIDQFDDFTVTLRTREAELGVVMDDFAQLTSVLAEERRRIQGLVSGLGRTAQGAVGLVAEHGAKLDEDVAILTRTLQSIVANMDSVRQVLDAGPVLTTGLAGAVDPTYHRVDLRTQFTPLVQQALLKVLGPLGIPLGDAVCIPVDVACQPNPGPGQPPAPTAAAPTPPGAGPGPAIPNLPLPTGPGPAGAPATATPTAPGVTTPPTLLPPITAPANPIDGLLKALSSRGGPAVLTAPKSVAERTASHVGGIGRLFKRAANAILGGGS